jgi:hypothetical protein
LICVLFDILLTNLTNTMENTTEQTETTTTVEVVTPKKSKTRFMPASQFDLLTLAENVASKWEITPQITLLWMKPAEFKNLVAEFRTFLGERLDAGSGRGSLTQSLKDLDKQINQAVDEVKIAILAKFGKNKGQAYFSEFGITKQSNKFAIPSDRNQRVNALPLLSKAIKNHNLQVTGFETAFFDSITADYTAAFQATQKTDSAVSVSVSNKNDMRKEIESVLSAINTLIKVNYPKTYTGELRGWGFQKEKY